MSKVIKEVDVVIIGGGPAGISAALWCDELGLEAILLEKDAELGGQLRYVYNPIENHLGVRASNGLQMLAEFEKTMTARNFVRAMGIQVESIDVDSMLVNLVGPTKQAIFCHSIVLATGVRRKILGIPGEVDFRGRGVLESGSRDKESVRGKNVMIVGGGDAALENAMILSEFASSVCVAFRREDPTARFEFVDAAMDAPNVTLLPSTILTRISGNERVEWVEIEDGSDTRIKREMDAVLIRIGVEPNSELVRGLVEFDEDSYVKVDHLGRTSVEGIYAVGDVANMESPTLSTAIGTGATAAKTIFHSISNREAL